MTATPQRSLLLRNGLVLGSLTVLALLLTWPLASHFTTHVTGDGIDDPALVWNLWWLKARLVDQFNPEIFQVDWMFHPVTINLAFYTLTPLNGLLSVPLQTAFSLVVANNLLLLSSFVLGGFGAYLLALDQMRWAVPCSSTRTPHPSPLADWRLLAALAAGVVYAFASSKLFYASLGQFNIASSQWVPFCVLYLMRMVGTTSARVRLRSAAMAGLFLVFQAWAELTYASFLLIFAALLLVFALLLAMIDAWRAGDPVLRRFINAAGHMLIAFGVVGAVFLLGIMPILAAMLPDMRADGDFFASGGGFADVFSADLFGYLVPTRLHPFVGDWVATLPFPNDKGQHIYIGYGALVLVVLGLGFAARQRGNRRWLWFWPLTLAFFWLLTLGPQVRWLGEPTAIPGPFALVSQLPFFSGNRYPSRYSIMVMLAAAVCASWGVAWLLQRTASWRATLLAGAVVVMFAIEHLSAPLPLSDFAVPAMYARLASMPKAAEGGVLLELPTGWRNGARVLGKSDLLIMLQQWYQTTHGLRRLGGNTSRNPAYKFQYFTEAPLIGDLIALMNADRPHIAAVVDVAMPELVARGLANGAQVLDFLGIEYITLHVEKAPPQLVNYVETVLPVTLVEEWQGPDWTGAPSTIRLYRVEPAPAPQGVTELQFGDAQGNLFLGAGWSPVADSAGWRLAHRAQPLLLLDLPVDGATVELTVTPAPASARVNGRAVELRGEGNVVRIDVPPGVADQPVDQLELAFAGAGESVATATRAAGDQPLSIGATGQVLPPTTSILVRSAGEEVGDFAHIYVNGQDLAFDTRGYNLVALNPSGEVMERMTFDTFADSAAAPAMARWLARWPVGTVIAGAVADEASTSLDQAAVDALRGVGVATDLRGKFRWSHAFIGVVGATSGAALEQSDLLGPATVYIGLPANDERIFGRLRAVKIVTN